METARCFIAVDIDYAIRRELASLQRRLQRTHADVKWVKPDSIHLTLAFLGNVPIDRIRPLESALDRALCGQDRFPLVFTGTGSFGKPRHPRVIWAGIKNCPSLIALQHKVVASLQETNVAFDGRPFSPHLTIGRVKTSKHAAGLIEALEQEQKTEFGCVEIAEALLIKSVLTPSGAEYSVLHRTALL